MDFKWEVEDEILVHRARPARRYMVHALGGHFPILQRLPDGAIAAVLRGADQHVGQRGRLELVFSRDGGESWSDAHVIRTARPDPCHAAFLATSRGELLVSYVLPHDYANGVFGGSMRVGPVYLARSADRGATWSEPEEIDTMSIPADSRNPYGKMTELPDGTILMCVHVVWSDGGPLVSGSDNRHGAFILRSRDGGKTWGDASRLSDDNLGETALLALPSGKLIALLRRQPGDTALWQMDSADQGHTWSVPRRITGPRQHPGDLLLLEDGRILLTFGHRRVPFGVRALVSHDEGQTWDYEHGITLAAESLSTDCGYPSSVQLDDGMIVTVYYVARSLGPFHEPSLQGRDLLGPYAAAVKYSADDLPRA
jgi:hypothetical protein